MKDGMRRSRAAKVEPSILPPARDALGNASSGDLARHIAVTPEPGRWHALALVALLHEARAAG
jgi:hypothetical protein